MFSGKTKIQGTRSYMSPEQIRGQALDQRADIYSFGCLIYELLGGKPPYTGATTNELLTKHLRSAIPPIQGSNRNVSDAFAQLVKSMLAKEPGERPDSMGDFLREMRSSPIFKVAAVRHEIGPRWHRLCRPFHATIGGIATSICETPRANCRGGH